MYTYPKYGIARTAPIIMAIMTTVVIAVTFYTMVIKQTPIEKLLIVSAIQTVIFMAGWFFMSKMAKSHIENLEKEINEKLDI